MAVQDNLLTIEEFAALPDNGKKQELVKGVVIEMPPPKPRHGRIQTRFARFLDSYMDEHDLGLVTTETGYIVTKDPATVRSPDIAFISKERAGDSSLDEYFPVAPGLAIEVVSAYDLTSEIIAKTNEYFQSGSQ